VTTITSLSPTDVGAKVSYDLGNEKKLGTIADFNCSCVHVRIDDGTTLPMPWHLLERVAGEPGPAVVNALASLEQAGLPGKMIDAATVEVAGLIIWTPAAGSWKVRGENSVHYGGFASVAAAARELPVLEGLRMKSEPVCTFSRCPNPDQCREGCSSPMRSPSA
jgi:hypothetical protein